MRRTLELSFSWRGAAVVGMMLALAFCGCGSSGGGTVTSSTGSGEAPTTSSRKVPAQHEKPAAQEGKSGPIEKSDTNPPSGSQDSWGSKSAPSTQPKKPDGVGKRTTHPGGHQEEHLEGSSPSGKTNPPSSSHDSTNFSAPAQSTGSGGH